VVRFHLTHTYIGMYFSEMARQRTSSDVFNAVGDSCRRSILDALADRESTVGELVDQLGLSQPQASKHLRVLRDVDLVRCRTLGRRRVYRIHGPAFVPLRTWLTQLTASFNEHYDRLDDYLDHLQSPLSATTSAPSSASTRKDS
jgi:DNA-binding transcriptional ArsR family regulator